VTQKACGEGEEKKRLFSTDSILLGFIRKKIGEEAHRLNPLPPPEQAFKGYLVLIN
jgi:hypothetical protein